MSTESKSDTFDAELAQATGWVIGAFGSSDQTFFRFVVNNKIQTTPPVIPVPPNVPVTAEAIKMARKCIEDFRAQVIAFREKLPGYMVGHALFVYGASKPFCILDDVEMTLLKTGHVDIAQLRDAHDAYYAEKKKSE